MKYYPYLCFTNNLKLLVMNVNVENIASAIKNYLIDLAVNDNLPMDLNDLNEIEIEEVIKTQLPTDCHFLNDKAIDKASELLSYGTHEELVAMVEAIANNENQDELIDYIDCVQVWEKIEFEFTCKEFIENIGYVK